MVGPRRALALGVVFGLSLAACAGAKFNYRWYSLRAAEYTGTLLGQSPKDDLSFEECHPDPEPSPGVSPGPAPKRVKCVVLLTDEFLRLRTEHLELEQRLIECQEGR